MSETGMRRIQLKKLSVLLTALMLPASVLAVELDEAAKQAAKNNNAKVLSAKTVKQGGGGKTHEIKLLTNKGVVKTIKVPDSNKKKKKKH